MTAARLKASEQREKEYYSRTLEEAHGPRETGGEPVPAVVAPDGPPVIVRTPVQEGGSSSSGGQLPSGGDLLVTTGGAPFLMIQPRVPLKTRRKEALLSGLLKIGQVEGLSRTSSA